MDERGTEWQIWADAMAKVQPFSAADIWELLAAVEGDYVKALIVINGARRMGLSLMHWLEIARWSAEGGGPS